jgi:hypothetical protein
MEQHFRMVLFEALRHENVERAVKIARGLAQAQAIKPDYDIEFWSRAGDVSRTEQTSDILGGDRLAITADSKATDNWMELVSRIEYVANPVREHNGESRPAEQEHVA